MNSYQAAQFAQDFLFVLEDASSDMMVESVRNEPDGWIFYLGFKQLKEDLFVGGCPLFVSKKGEFALIPASLSDEEFLHIWRAGNLKNHRIPVEKLKRMLGGRYRLPRKLIKEIERVVGQSKLSEGEKIKRIKALKSGW